MKNAQHHGLKKESHSTNQFNDSEYKRWSEGIAADKPGGTQWGIESFLDPNENPRPGCEDISISSVEIGEE